MDEGQKKPSLTIDRAAFLLLRVKKAFKKKRQQRKDKQAAQAAAALAAQAAPGKSTKRGPVPLLRSRTLPTIVVPGISIPLAQIDPLRLTVDVCGSTSYAARHSLQPKTSRGSIASDDSTLEYRRKSAGSPHSGGGPFTNNNNNFNNNNNNSLNIEPYIYAFDDCERHPDGTVVLRIPSPHVVAARAYRISGGISAMLQQQSSNTLQVQSAVTPMSQPCSSAQSSTALYRLARLLNQSKQNQPDVLKDDAPRRLSWERRDHANSRMPRSSSIDSMVDAVWSEPTPRPSLTVPEYHTQQQQSPLQPPQHLQVNYGNSGSVSRRESVMSPSSSRRTKQNRGVTEISLPDLISKTTSFQSIHINKTRPSSSLTSLKGDKPTRLVHQPNSMEFLMPAPLMQNRPAPSSGLLRSTSHQSNNHNSNNNNNNNNNIKNGHQNGGGGGVKIVNNRISLQQHEHNNHYPLQQLHQQHNKMSKKQLKLAQAQLDKLTQINIHLHALFSAVEHGHLDKARTILESTDVDVNSLNTDGLSPLDVAVLSNNRSMTKMLLQHGANEGTQFKTSDSLGNHLNELLHEAESQIQELSGAEDSPQAPYSTRASFSSIIGNAYTVPMSMTVGCAGSDADKQIGLWERRVKGLRRMILGWDQARPPDPPQHVTADVTAPNTVTVRIQEPNDGPLTTKYKIEWSSRADFSHTMGERLVYEWTSFQGAMGATCRATDLTQGRRYFFRARCGNVKGWGAPRLATPNSVMPSSWRDMDQRESRFAGRQRILDELFGAVRLARPDNASEIVPFESQPLQRRNPKKKTTIKQLFSAASKFQKNLRRGIYMACILYHEDKVLVTNEDFIPVIEIDETYPSCLHTDYHWLMKVACTWDDVRSLRTDMEKNATSAVHFRTKLLSAACQMQSALCISDLGQLFHKPLRDAHGTVVLSCVNAVKTPKSVSVLNSRWLPLNKVQKKLTALHEDNNINEILMSSIQEQINYHQSSSVRLTKGLYLGYLKMQSSVDQIQVVVPSKTPNVLPHCKIRENPHVSAEEWEFIKPRKSFISLDYRKNDRLTEVQQLFVEDLTHAAQRLFHYMDISDENALQHRLYNFEVIELSPDVSFLILCPPAESSCAVPGQREILLQRGDLLSLPIQAFEMIHLRTYQNGIIQKYSRLSCILELDTILANHSHREAFSSSEVLTAKERLAKLQDLSANLNAVWKGVRWLMDVIGFARDRCQSSAGLNIKDLLKAKDIKTTEMDSVGLSGSKRHLLEPPSTDGRVLKTSPGRGSWPGPAVSNIMGNGLLGAEHSKSEQHLVFSNSNISSRFLSATSGIESRKNSADSQYSHSGNSYYSAGESIENVIPRLPPSRSEDTLNAASKKHTPCQSHRKRATTVNSSFSTTSSPLLLNIRPEFESVQSLSSDSEGCTYQMATSTPNRVRTRSNSKTTHGAPDSSDSDSVKCKKQLFESGAAIATKPNPIRSIIPHVRESEESLLRESLHISEDKIKPMSSPFRGDDVPPINAPESSSAAATDVRSVVASASASNNAVGSPTKKHEEDTVATNGAGIIQVYAAYATGLASGTSLKLHVTPKTTAREVIDLVVKQLNMAVVLKGKDGPIYPSDKLENFCLVAVIGARERCLRDDFKPLQLQNPWKKGRLYVRQKHDLLAAIEHSNREAQHI